MVTAGVLKRHNHFSLIMSLQFSDKIIVSGMFKKSSAHLHIVENLIVKFDYFLTKSEFLWSQ